MNNDLGLVNKTDDTHFARALGADKRICFVHLADKVRPAPLLAFVSFSRLNLMTESQSWGDPGVFDLFLCPRTLSFSKKSLGTEIA